MTKSRNTRLFSKNGCIYQDMIDRLKYYSVILTLLVLLGNTGKSKTTELWNGKIYTTIIPGGGNLQFSRAQYTMFIPKGLVQIKGILIHQHGCTMEGTGIQVANDIQYQAFAKKWGLAILAPDIYPHGKNCFEWYNPQNGSEIALFAGLNTLSKMSEHIEIKSAPWLLWGHSGGGHWALSMLNKYPERIIAVVSYSAAFDSLFNYPLTVAKIPVLLRHAGIGDHNSNWAKCWLTAVHNFSKLRNSNGFVSIAHNKNQTHNLSYIRYMTIPFFESVLAQRLPLNGYSNLRDIDTTKSWLGDTITTSQCNIYKASAFNGNKHMMSWLPDSICAEKYKEYVTFGTIRDYTPPSAPFDVKINVLQQPGIEITWEADADIESGIKYFNIYKNGQLLSRYPLDADFQTFNKNGDNPIPPIAPEMHFQVPGIIIDKADKIEVTTVNGDGLESVKAFL